MSGGITTPPTCGITGKVIHLNREPFIVVGIASDNSVNFVPGGLWVPYRCCN